MVVIISFLDCLVYVVVLAVFGVRTNFSLLMLLTECFPGVDLSILIFCALHYDWYFIIFNW